MRTLTMSARVAALALAALAIGLHPAQAEDADHAGSADTASTTAEAFCEAAIAAGKFIGPDKDSFRAWCQPEAAKLEGTQAPESQAATEPSQPTDPTTGAPVRYNEGGARPSFNIPQPPPPGKQSIPSPPPGKSGTPNIPSGGGVAAPPPPRNIDSPRNVATPKGPSGGVAAPPPPRNIDSHGRRNAERDKERKEWSDERNAARDKDKGKKKDDVARANQDNDIRRKKDDVARSDSERDKGKKRDDVARSDSEKDKGKKRDDIATGSDAEKKKKKGDIATGDPGKIKDGKKKDDGKKDDIATDSDKGKKKGDIATGSDAPKDSSSSGSGPGESASEAVPAVSSEAQPAVSSEAVPAISSKAVPATSSAVPEITGGSEARAALRDVGEVKRVTAHVVDVLGKELGSNVPYSHIEINVRPEVSIPDPQVPGGSISISIVLDDPGLQILGENTGIKIDYSSIDFSVPLPTIPPMSLGIEQGKDGKLAVVLSLGVEVGPNGVTAAEVKLTEADIKALGVALTKTVDDIRRNVNNFYSSGLAAYQAGEFEAWAKGQGLLPETNGQRLPETLPGGTPVQPWESSNCGPNTCDPGGTPAVPILGDGTSTPSPPSLVCHEVLSSDDNFSGQVDSSDVLFGGSTTVCEITY